MAKREDKPMQNGFRALATVVSMTLMSAAPVLAAPDRNLCDEASEATLDVANADFSKTPVTNSDEPVELLGPNFEMTAQEKVVEEEVERNHDEQIGEDSAELEQNDATISTRYLSV